MKTSIRPAPPKSAAEAAASLRITGDMTIYQAEELRQKLLASLGAAGTVVALDLTDVTEIDSAGIQLLIAAKHAATAVGKVLSLTAISPAVTEVFTLFGLATYFTDPAAA